MHPLCCLKVILIHTVLLDLPKLNTIELGYCSLRGKHTDTSCTLIMRSMSYEPLHMCRSSQLGFSHFRTKEFVLVKKGCIAK